VPAYMMQIETIPVTRNGKLDKRALPEIEARDDKEYIAPRNETEDAICQVFSEILNVERVGVKDSFFELGGDSIKAIRITTKLRDCGYITNVKDIMSYKTPEKLSYYVKAESSELKYEQGEVNGIIEETPMLQAFKKWDLAVPHHFNQSMIFDVSKIENSIIRASIKAIVQHHDILRSVYRNGVQVILPINESKLFDMYEFDYSKESDKQRAVADKCTEIQGSIDLENGPIVKIAVFDLGDKKMMMFCVHHIAIDGVSWRILAEDFDIITKQLSNNEELILPAKTASFIEWSRKLKEYGENLSHDVKMYWINEAKKLPEGLIQLSSEDNECAQAMIMLNESITEKLVTKSSNAYGAKTNEVILAGLAKAIRKITGQDILSVQIEGHGREEIHEHIAIDRTVGWFTNAYFVNIGCSEDNGRAIIAAKDAMRSVPNAGMGCNTIPCDIVPDIFFNYHGEIGSNAADHEEVYSAGIDISEQNILPGNININGSINNGKIMLYINSQDPRFGISFMSKLKTGLEECLTDLAEFCMENNSSEQTISDMDAGEMDDDELSFINSLV